MNKFKEVGKLQEKIKIRCAIYTRKSNDEGLEQAFNSLDAQRLAGESYIASQAHEGWECLPTQYNDGGYSGGNLERPALQRLLQDIEDGKVDCIVVYKIDRLTRSLLDFQKIIELLDRHNCSFVAVTQSFNTSNSMGRLMLNVLLSFAQYERELTSERIRDKYEASSKLGIWMGGHPPLGYDPKNRELFVNEQEAQIVRAIYKSFIETTSVTETTRIINMLGYKTKSWVSEKGKSYSGGVFTKRATRYILTNPIYAGKIVHKGKIYPGKHESIIEPEEWERIQNLFKSPGKVTKSISRISNPPLLKGIFYCGCCNSKMTPTYSMKKNGSKYRYYICSSRNRLANENCSIGNIAAAEVEQSVIDQVLRVISRPEIVAKVIEHTKKLAITSINDQVKQEEVLEDIHIIEALRDAAKVWDELFHQEQTRIIHLLINSVTIFENRVDIRIFSDGLNDLGNEINNGSNNRNNQNNNNRNNNNKNKMGEAA